jgi:hypothetical protein
MEKKKAKPKFFKQKLIDKYEDELKLCQALLKGTEKEFKNIVLAYGAIFAITDYVSQLTRGEKMKAFSSKILYDASEKIAYLRVKSEVFTEFVLPEFRKAENKTDADRILILGSTKILTRLIEERIKINEKVASAKKSAVAKKALELFISMLNVTEGPNPASLKAFTQKGNALVKRANSAYSDMLEVFCIMGRLN